MKNLKNGFWGVVCLMGYEEVAGYIKLLKNNLVRVDVPDGKNGKHTELFGMNAIFSIIATNPQIAKARAKVAVVRTEERLFDYTVPIIPLQKHEKILRTELKNSAARELEKDKLLEKAEKELREIKRELYKFKKKLDANQ